MNSLHTIYSIACIPFSFVIIIDFRLMIFTHACELQLSFNKLSLIPEGVGSFVHLTVLDLRFYSIYSCILVPQAIATACVA